MGTVLKFPQKMTLPEEIEKRLNEVAKVYVEVMMDAQTALLDENSSKEELAEAGGLILETYLKSVQKAIDEYE